jgi:hypothetical protein
MRWLELHCTVWLGALACLGAGAVYADEMYKTIDAQGHVTYSDHPLSSDSKRINVEVTSGDPAEAARIKRDQAANSAAANQTVEQAHEDEIARSKKQQEAAQQQQRCALARSRYAMFAAGGRLFHTDDQGNRVYYSDDEIEQQRTATRAAMEKDCGAQE